MIVPTFPVKLASRWCWFGKHEGSYEMQLRSGTVRQFVHIWENDNKREIGGFEKNSEKKN